MDNICNWFGISRQAHYQMLDRQQKQEKENEEILDMVRAIRERHTQMGGRKLLHKISPKMRQKGIKKGRDSFFDLLREKDLLIKQERAQRRTTWAGLWRYPNRLEGLAITGPQQVWVADITYLETEEGFCYLSLITDAYSRYIVGYDVSTSLSVEGAQRALEMAIAQAAPPLTGLIHHSDHGVQYTSNAYRDRLEELGILPSMGEIGNCYDNALAERMNGILKLEYGLEYRFVNFKHALLATQEAIWLYNFDRPHLSLDYQVPADIHTPKPNAPALFRQLSL